MNEVKIVEVPIKQQNALLALAEACKKELSLKLDLADLEPNINLGLSHALMLATENIAMKSSHDYGYLTRMFNDIDHESQQKMLELFLLNNPAHTAPDVLASRKTYDWRYQNVYHFIVRSEIHVDDEISQICFSFVRIYDSPHDEKTEDPYANYQYCNLSLVDALTCEAVNKLLKQHDSFLFDKEYVAVMKLLLMNFLS